MATEPNRTEPNRTEPNRTEIIHDLENNFKQNNILKLKQLFPEVFCEDQVDFEKLKLVLGAENLAGAGERYQLDWAGKTVAYLNLQSPTSRTLVPCKEESADFDGTQNVFIEAENLEALKILQKSYAGSVKMIYIDPPYNTGNDSFIYPDKFSESREEYARRVGDTDDAGYLKRDGVFQGAWRKNGKDSGHYHSNWLSMMLPRLHLAKTLLREDGVIFISIDDNEQAQLKLLCDEVFGAENFVECFSWVKTSTPPSLSNKSRKTNEYILCYEKNRDNEKYNAEMQSDGDEPLLNSGNSKRELIFPASSLKLKFIEEGVLYSGEYEKVNLLNNIIVKNGQPLNDVRLKGEFKWTQKKLDEEIKNGTTFIAKTEKMSIRFQRINKGNKRPTNFIRDHIITPVINKKEQNVGTNEDATKELKEIFNVDLFDHTKPVTLIKYLINFKVDGGDLIMDFFSGSGTTAHAVMQLNAEDGGSRRFICVQLPEETDEKSEARKAGFNTIAEIAKERIRRAGRQISDGLQDGSEIDTGFKVFKLAESGFKQWRQPGQADTEALQRELSLNIDSVLSETSSENLLYELMLRMGLKLTCKVSFSDDVYCVEDEDTGGLYAFLLKRVDQGLIDAVLAKHPVKVAALDRLFEGDDALKSNTVLQMKDAGVMFECV